jgi:hypothetical protein
MDFLVVVIEDLAGIDRNVAAATGEIVHAKSKVRLKRSLA